MALWDIFREQQIELCPMKIKLPMLMNRKTTNVYNRMAT